MRTPNDIRLPKRIVNATFIVFMKTNDFQRLHAGRVCSKGTAQITDWWSTMFEVVLEKIGLWKSHHLPPTQPLWQHTQINLILITYKHYYNKIFYSGCWVGCVFLRWILLTANSLYTLIWMHEQQEQEFYLS